MVVISRPYEPFIPEFIKVHLGEPDEPAEDVVVSFTDYIKNVASSEIYPTWPESAIRANIYAQITFALNRIYTEWYRSRGYDFDITNSTRYDQAFVKDREIFENISKIVDEIFNSYVVKRGQIQPYFTAYCDGRVTQCEGLLQWGTVPLAQEGYGPYDILQYYYGEDIDILRDVPVRANFESYPLYPLRLGSFGRDVSIIQNELNRIRINYPSIPLISNDGEGVFGVETEAAVRRFQEIFNLTPDGIVGNATWYKIKQVFNAVKGLGELASEGISPEDFESPFVVSWQEGDYGFWVRLLQYYIRALACLYPDEIPKIELTGYFGPETTEAVLAIQTKFDLILDGVVGIQTYAVLDREYRNNLYRLPADCFGVEPPYPGYLLSRGMGDKNVNIMQEYLEKITEADPSLPRVTVTGIFDDAMLEAVRALQERHFNEVNDVIDPNTWLLIVRLYQELGTPPPEETT